MKIVFKRVKSKKQLFFLLFVILLNLILWNKLYLLRKQSRQTQDILKLQQNQRVHWQTYTDKKYGFAFQHVAGWITKDDVCPSEPFCLIVTDYNRLSTEQQLKEEYPEGFLDVEISDVLILTKEEFAKFKTNLENGVMPQTVLDDGIS